jgi:N6-L-threonylcarbamoyladenine synthase
MNILAIESSCDDTGAAVVRNGREVLSNVVASQVPEHVIYGGVVPEIASRRHCESISAVCRKALEDAKMTLSDIDAVAVTYAPGLIGALLVGVNFAKGLSYANGLPLIPVQHLRGHVASNYISSPALEPPFTALIVSGGHTHLVNVENYTEYSVIGRTRDDAAGEAMDKAARLLGYPYPGGLNMEKACANGDAKKYVFPRPRVDSSEFDFSFSGMKTAAINLIHNKEQKGEPLDRENIGASYMHSVVKVLCDRSEKAIVRFRRKSFVLAGGVSANSVLREQMQILCDKHGVKLYMPELRYCGDNAAMIGAQAYYEFLAGHTADLKLNAAATMDIYKNYSK